MALSTIVSDKLKETITTQKNVHQVLDCLAINPYATIIFNASGMVLNIHLDASYLSAKHSNSRASGHLLLGSVPKYGEPITLNCAIFNLCTILKLWHYQQQKQSWVHSSLI